jgi:hypothetical protein
MADLNSQKEDYEMDIIYYLHGDGEQFKGIIQVDDKKNLTGRLHDESNCKNLDLEGSLRIEGNKTLCILTGQEFAGTRYAVLSADNGDNKYTGKWAYTSKERSIEQVGAPVRAIINKK